MKTFITILFCLLGINLWAQHPDLYPNFWQFDKLELNGETYYAPSNEQSPDGILFLTFDDSEVSIQSSCNFMMGAIQYQDENGFTLSEGLGVTLNGCAFTENEDFENHYFYEFWTSGNVEQPNHPFQYEIQSVGGFHRLIVTNSEGNKAYYNQNFANTQEWNSADSIQMAFKDELLYITNSAAVSSLEVYNMNGQLVHRTQKIEQNSLRIPILTKGVYVINVRTVDGLVFSKKLRKF